MTDADRTHDIVVWGATGVAGRFVAEYLTERYAPDDLSLAVGGRSPERLEQLVSDLTGRSDAWDDVPVVVGDATDPESLRAIARDTRVVCTTVGPYTTYGTPLVDACVEAGTDYCDLTGEINWVRDHRPVPRGRRSTPKLGSSTAAVSTPYLRISERCSPSRSQWRRSTHPVRRFGSTSKAGAAVSAGHLGEFRRGV